MFYKVIAVYNALAGTYVTNNCMLFSFLGYFFLSYFRANQRVRDPLVFKVLLTIIWHMAKHELFRGRVVPRPYFYSSAFPSIGPVTLHRHALVYLLQSYLAFPRLLEEGLFGRVG